VMVLKAKILLQVQVGAAMLIGLSCHVLDGLVCQGRHLQVQTRREVIRAVTAQGDDMD
jgi:hypothetical protein